MSYNPTAPTGEARIQYRAKIVSMKGCPKCGAGPGMPCEGRRGDRLAPHRERLWAKPVFTEAEVRAYAKRKAANLEFYTSDAWRRVRYRALKKHGNACQCCGTPASRKKPLHVDHIKPRSKHPELELDINNLQILCEDCNLGKGSWDETDWRP